MKHHFHNRSVHLSFTPYTPLTSLLPLLIGGRPFSPSNEFGDSPGLSRKYDPQEELEQALGGLQTFLHENINNQEREEEGEGVGVGYGGGESGRGGEIGSPNMTSSGRPKWSRGAIGRVRSPKQILGMTADASARRGRSPTASGSWTDPQDRIDVETLAVQGLRAKDWQTNMLRLTDLFHYLQLPPPGEFAQIDAALPDAKLIEVLDLGGSFQTSVEMFERLASEIQAIAMYRRYLALNAYVLDARDARSEMSSRGLAKAAARRKLGTANSEKFGGFGGFRGFSGSSLDDKTTDLPMSPFYTIAPRGRSPPLSPPPGYHGDEGGLGGLSSSPSSRGGMGAMGSRFESGFLEIENGEGGMLGEDGLDGQGDVSVVRGEGEGEGLGDGNGYSRRDVIPPPTTRPTTGESGGGHGLIQSDLIKRIQTTSAGSKHRAKHAYLLDIAMGEGSDDENNGEGGQGSVSVCASDMAHIPKLDKRELLSMGDVPYLLQVVTLLINNNSYCLH